MTICKECKHNKIVKYPIYEPYSFYSGEYNKSEPQKTQVFVRDEECECCTLNPMTGQNDFHDKNFTGNKYFNCGGFEDGYI